MADKSLKTSMMRFAFAGSHDNGLYLVFPQPCKTDISCSFSDRIRGIHGVIDGPCVNVPPCRCRMLGLRKSGSVSRIDALLIPSNDISLARRKTY